MPTGFVNQHGDAFFCVQQAAGGLAPITLFLNSSPYTDWVAYGSGPTPEGINDRRDVIWDRWTADSLGPHSHAMVNHYDLSDNNRVGGLDWMAAGAVGINEAGQVAWGATYNDGSWYPHYSYVGTANYNDLYGQYDTDAYGIINRGQLLWKHYDNADGSYAIYVDDTNISISVMHGDTAALYPTAINDRSDVLWYGYNYGAGWKGNHAFVNQTDITMAYLGQDRDSRAIALNQNDQALWLYKDTPQLRYALMLDRNNISGNLTDFPDGVALNDRGDVLWSYGNVGTGYQHVCVNQYDLTADLLGGQAYDYAYAMDINGAGQVLWAVAKNNQLYYYLSTLVPEPSVLLLGLPVLMAIRRRPK